MRIHFDPPPTDWPTPTARRPIWTGHQTTLFHPGILAKYEAAAAAARRAGVPYRAVRLDQDVYDPLTLAVPCRDGDRLSTRTVSLAKLPGPVPGGCLPPVRVDEVVAGLKQWPGEATVRLDPAVILPVFAEAFDEAETLNQQMDGVLSRLLPGVYEPSVPASGLLDAEDELLERLKLEAEACAAHYNAAVREHPAAGMARLTVQPDRIEVPLWSLRWRQPRQRVYVDIADSTPIFITEDGEPIPGDATLAPRALLMTALLRRPDRACLFIHGTGGGVYDRITEQWWRNWQGQKLAPMAVVTADLFLDFDAPVADHAALRRAVWWKHHLPHNLDRHLGLTGSPAREKRDLLKHMDDDRDPARRRAAFTLIHRINAGLAQQHPGPLAEAQRQLRRAEAGVVNAAVARRRDWPFLFYPEKARQALRQAIETRFAPDA
jgi:hypothetical protein